MLSRLASFCFRRRRLVLGVWLVLLVAAVLGGGRAAGKTASGGRLAGTDSQRARDLLIREFPAQSGQTATIVIGNLPGHRPSVDGYAATVARDPGVTQLDPIRVSANGEVGVIPITLRNGSRAVTSATVRRMEDLARPLRREGVDIEFAGHVFSSGGVPSTEFLGLLAAVIVLLVAFGSVLAMGLPIVTALFGLGVTAAAVGIVARLFTTPSFTGPVAAMIGLGVGIDYALLIVTRHRQALQRTGNCERAVVEALATAGRAVVFAGCTVVASLLGMFIIGLDFLHGLAVGTSLAVAIAVTAAVTLLPALLGFLGDRVLPHSRVSGWSGPSGWERWAGFVQRHPAPLAGVGVLVLTVMALPVLGMHLGTADAGNDPRGSTTRAAFDLVGRGFGAGANGPILVVADTRRPGSATALDRLVGALGSSPDVASAASPILSRSGSAALITVTPKGGPQDKATTRLLRHIRGDVIPPVTAGTGLVAHVGGETATNIDFSNVMARRLPYFLAGVLALSFLLLMMVFRSMVVPLKAVFMNLMSIGAAYGAMVAVFQWGWGRRALGVTGAPIEAWAPMMLFAVVFGLSMDYEVFLLTAIREHHDSGADNSCAVSAGLASTGRVITAAATVMVVVFGSFLTSEVRSMKEIGFGLALAIAVDATVVRLVLVPTTMELLGRANWWLPTWLARVLPTRRTDSVTLRTTKSPAAYESEWPELVAEAGELKAPLLALNGAAQVLAADRTRFHDKTIHRNRI